jgi:hypothetical protein
MEVKLIAKTEKGGEALRQMFKDAYTKKTPFFKIITTEEDKDPYTLKIVWSGVVIKALEQNPIGREHMLIGIRPLIPKYGCTEKDIEVI